MARLLLCVLALCVGAYAVPAVPVTYEKLDSTVLQERQQQILHLFSRLHKPIHTVEHEHHWDLKEHVNNFKNVTAVNILDRMIRNGWLLPKDKPLSLNHLDHIHEVMTVFNVLYSADSYETMLHTAEELWKVLNPEVFWHVMNILVIHRHELQGIAIPPLYEVLPSYFFNAEILNTAQRISVLGKDLIKEYPYTHMWDENVVITWNHTLWPYNDEHEILNYFTHDHYLNLAYYNYHLQYPFWLGSDVVPGLDKDRRGEAWWLRHRQLLARYYMERLSNGLGEIPEITNVVDEKFVSGLVYRSGVPLPARPAYYSLEQPHLVEEMEHVLEYERRVWEAIDKGYIVNEHGEHINILTEDGFNLLTNLVETNANSINSGYYKNFIVLWKAILGNSVQHHLQYHNQAVPLVLPSALENYWTAMRDPAFYMMWKRVLKLFTHWQKRMPQHKPEDLIVPGVKIEKVEVDKLVTYFAYSYINITEPLYLNIHEKSEYHPTGVLVATPTLNHKPFSIKLNIQSEVAKPVIAKIFLAPKYDSKGFEIPLHKNTENFMLIDMFPIDLAVGGNVYIRQSGDNTFTIKDWPTTHEIYEKTMKGIWTPDMGHVTIEKFPDHLVLPKGKVGGMPFQVVVYLQEYRKPKIPYGTGFDPKISLGTGTGARYFSDMPFAFPTDRPLHIWQVKDVPNMYFHDVLIHHKHTPEIYVPHSE